MSIALALCLLVITSCNTSEEVIPSQLGVESLANKSNNLLNTFSNQKKIKAFVADRDSVIKFFEANYSDYILTWKQNNPSFKEDEIEATLIQEYINCSNCGDAYKSFLVPLLEELIEAKNEDVIGIIEKYQNTLLTNNYSQIMIDEVGFVLFSFKTGAEAYFSHNSSKGFWSCAGKSIGRGIAGGFLTGCAITGTAAGIAGTAFVPGFGTVAGAVAGCIKGGALGAVAGAAFGAFWAWADCG